MDADIGLRIKDAREALIWLEWKLASILVDESSKKDQKLWECVYPALQLIMETQELWNEQLH